MIFRGFRSRVPSAPMAGALPMSTPSGMRRLFENESLLSRLVQMAGWTSASRLLEVGASASGLAVAKSLGCHVTIADVNPETREATRALAQLRGVSDFLTFEAKSVEEFIDNGETFDGVFSFDRVWGSPGAIAMLLRPLLRVNGRVGFSCALRDSGERRGELAAFWSERLDRAAPLRAEALVQVTESGYEPELVETPDADELRSFYATLRKSLPGNLTPAAAKEAALEVRAFHADNTPTTYPAFVVARRSDPGEAPAPG